MASLLEQADQLIDLRRYDDAEQLIRRALAEDRRSAHAQILRARIGIARDDWTMARESARVAAALEPESADVHATLALAVLSDEEYEPDHRLADLLSMRSGDSMRLAEAQYHADRAVELAPESAHVHGIRARVLLARDETAKALAAADAGLSIDPADAGCRTARHDALVLAGRDEEAARFTRECLGDDPDDECSHARLAQLALERGDFAAAFEHAQAALRRDPNYEDAQSIYWTAAAHFGPGVGTVARVRAAFLRLIQGPLRAFVASPGTTFLAALIFAIALLILAISSLRQGDIFLGWGAIIVLAIPVMAVSVPVAIWAGLHLVLIIRRRDRRATIPWRGWLLGAAAGVWVLGYTVLSFVALKPSRRSFFVPPLLAACPLYMILLATSGGLAARGLAATTALATAAFAVFGFWATRAGDSEAQFRCMVFSGTLTLLAEVVIRRLDRRATTGQREAG